MINLALKGMLPARKILAVALALVLVVRFVDGNQRVVHVNEMLNDDEDYLTSASDGDDNHICCLHGNCSCNSLDLALAYLTSNVMINITTDVTLSSIIEASDLERVSIIGHNNPTVNCKVTGVINFAFCHNCIIQGITWNGCGTETKPALKLSNSLNITAKNCSFKHSRGQALVLSDVSGDVDINHCNFVHNNHYRGHGAAVHYSLSNVTNTHLLFMISNCNFTYNKGRGSVVYIENKIFDHQYSTIFHYSKFHDNQCASIYAINQNIYLTGRIVFQNNIADNGAGICISNHSTIIFGKNSNVEFSQNSAEKNGGAVFLSNYSSVLFHQNCIVRFIANHAVNGSAIYTKVYSTVIFTGTGNVTFTKNGGYSGGAIYTRVKSTVIFAGTCKVIFTNNSGYYGAAIYTATNSTVKFTDTCKVRFANNLGRNGGAIHSEYHGCISFEGNSSTVFSINNANEYGGAIHIKYFNHISFKGNSVTEFSNHYAYKGGAVYSTVKCTVSFEENSTSTFSNNTAMHGSALCFDEVFYASFHGNLTTVFSNNIAESINGGAIYGNSYFSSIYFGGSSTTVFKNNVAYSSKIGAIFIGAVYDAIFSDNSSVNFADNITSGDAIFIS